MSQYKLSDIRVYLDADVLGLAHLLCSERPDFTYPGDQGGRVKKMMRPPCPIDSPATPDEVWIPRVAGLGWLIVTRDARIQEKPAELAAVRENGARMVNLASSDALTVWGQLEVFMTQWRSIEALIEQPGPFIMTASRTGKLRAIDLSPAARASRQAKRHSVRHVNSRAKAAQQPQATLNFETTAEERNAKR